MKAPEPIPRVPIENLRSSSIRELRFASRMALTLGFVSDFSGCAGEVWGWGRGAYTSSVLRILLTRLPAAWTISSATLW